MSLEWTNGDREGRRSSWYATNLAPKSFCESRFSCNALYMHVTSTQGGEKGSRHTQTGGKYSHSHTTDTYHGAAELGLEVKVELAVPLQLRFVRLERRRAHECAHFIDRVGQLRSSNASSAPLALASLLPLCTLRRRTVVSVFSTSSASSCSPVAPNGGFSVHTEEAPASAFSLTPRSRHHE